MYVAEHYLGLEVEQREVYLDEVPNFVECGSVRYCSCYFSDWKDCRSWS